MGSVYPLSMDQALIEKYKQLPVYHRYTRTLHGSSEAVGYPPGSTVRFWFNDEPDSYALHWHPAVEMIVPLENGYTVTVAQKAFRLVPGDILIVPSGELHQLCAPPTGCRMILLFELGLLSGIKGFSYFTSFLSQPVLMNRATCGPIYEREAELVSQLCADYLCDSVLREVTIYARLMEFFLNYVNYRLSRTESGEPVPVSDTRQREHSDRLSAAFLYLDEHYLEDLTLETAAGVAGFSKYHFSRIFKEFSGYNFYDYICRKRIKTAELLLLEPGLSITEVALRSGFSSVSTFNRTFKKIKDCTPTEYRGLYQDSLART